MNEPFVNVKVDREERPDVDAIYMDAVQAMTGRGGWPMTVFMTPDGEPFYGGTYFPKPKFLHLLDAVDDLWRNRPAELGAAHRRAHRGARSHGQLERRRPTYPERRARSARPSTARRGIRRRVGRLRAAPEVPARR